jgi:hypothetical protein
MPMNLPRQPSHRSTRLATHLSPLITAIAFAGAASAAGGATGPGTQITWDTPTFDRWNYPFNITPGSRAQAPTFSPAGLPAEFDQRDGQFVITFQTDDDIEPDLHRGQYTITSAVITATLGSNAAIVFDPTMDSFETFTTIADDDPGRAMILAGTAFRNGLTAETYGETGAYGPAGVDVRFAYAATYDNSGALVDISNNIRDAFDPAPFAVGQAETGAGDPIAPGAAVPPSAVYVFTIDISDDDIQCYLKTALRDGYASFTVTSLHPTSMPPVGPAAVGAVDYPQWRTKEDLEVVFGLATATSFQITVDVVPTETFEPADVNTTNGVNIDDILAVINAFGAACNCCSEDANDSGQVNIDDLLLVVNGF